MRDLIALNRLVGRWPTPPYATDIATEIGEEDVYQAPPLRSVDIDDLGFFCTITAGATTCTSDDIFVRKVLVNDIRNVFVNDARHFEPSKGHQLLDFGGRIELIEDTTSDAADTWRSYIYVIEDAPLRGVVAVSHPREVIFTKDVEFRLRDLPSWKPRAYIDRRTLEAFDE